MSEMNYGDLVQAEAKRIANLLDQGKVKSAGNALSEYSRSMSAPEFNRLLRTTNQLEKDMVGFDIYIDSRDSTKKPGLRDDYGFMHLNFDNSIYAPKPENLKVYKPVKD